MEQLMREWRQAELRPIDRALCAFAEKLTLTPSEMTPADLDALRVQGLTDEAIHDAVQVVAYFAYINRVADALGTDLEDWMGREPPWAK